MKSRATYINIEHSIIFKELWLLTETYLTRGHNAIATEENL